MNRLILLSFFTLLSVVSQAGKLDKGFEALYQFDYFKAKEYFEKSLEKETAGAAFGLCKVYAAEKSPFFNVDTAFKFIQICDKSFKLIEEKDLEPLTELEITSATIRREKINLAEYFFKRAIETNTVDGFQEFISEHPDGDDIEEAEKLRNHLAYEIAEEEDTMEGYDRFLKDYPEAADFALAQKKYYLLEYHKLTREGDAYSYKMFILNRPESPYISEAEEEVYAIYTQDGKPESYESFIGENPENPHVDEAWDILFKLRTSKYTPGQISEFMIDYPEYPKAADLGKELELSKMKLVPARQGDVWGFVDTNGAWVLSPKFSWAANFSEGKALVGLFGKTVYVNKKGTLIYSHMFDDATSFKDDLAIVELEDKMGVINFMGDTVIPIIYEELGAFSQGLIYAGLNGEYGFFNEEGKEVVPLKYETVFDFDQNKAIVKQDGLYGMINVLGQPLLPCSYEWIIPDSANYVVKKGDYFGLISSLGDTLLNFEYTSISSFHNGRAIAVKDGKYQYIDYTGKPAFKQSYEFTPSTLNYSSFKDGYARVRQKDKVGIIDVDGNKVMPAIFMDMGYYDEVLTPITKTGKWGYANAKVELAIPYQYNYAYNFIDGYAVVEDDTSKALINVENELVVPFGYSQIEVLDTFNILVEKEGAFGLINFNLEPLVPLEYSTYQVKDSHVVFQSDSSMVLFWRNSQTIIYKEE